MWQKHTSGRRSNLCIGCSCHVSIGNLFLFSSLLILFIFLFSSPHPLSFILLALWSFEIQQQVPFFSLKFVFFFFFWWVSFIVCVSLKWAPPPPPVWFFSPFLKCQLWAFCLREGLGVTSWAFRIFVGV
jgi:hypothetical protein